MKPLMCALAAAAMLAGAQGAAAQNHRDGSDSHGRRDHDRDDRRFRHPMFARGFQGAWSYGYAAPLSYSYPEDDGRYDPFVYAYLDGPGRARAPECGYWEQGREAWTYVFVQTACAPHEAAWSDR